MTIAFWSNEKHVCGVSMSVAAISAVWSEQFLEKVYVSANHIGEDGVFSYLQGRDIRQRGCGTHCYGDPEYWRGLRRMRGKTTVLNGMVQVLPMEGSQSETNTEYEGLRSLQKEILPEAPLLIDVATGGSRSSMQVLKAADIIVVLLPEDGKSRQSLLDELGSMKKRCFFIFSKYNPSRHEAPSYVMANLGIPEKRSGIIPYNEDFVRSLSEGTLISFLADYKNCWKDDPKSYFLVSLLRTVVRLKKYAQERSK